VLAELTFDPGRTVALSGDDVTRATVLTLTQASTVDAVCALNSTQHHLTISVGLVTVDIAMT